MCPACGCSRSCWGDKPMLAGSAQLYDRLLAGHSFAFTETATLSTLQRHLTEYHDRPAIPALVLAQADHEAGLLSDHQTHRIAVAARQRCCASFMPERSLWRRWIARSIQRWLCNCACCAGALPRPVSASRLGRTQEPPRQRAWTTAPGGHRRKMAAPTSWRLARKRS